jgi:cell pole-organizing protein PopZ
VSEEAPVVPEPEPVPAPVPAPAPAPKPVAAPVPAPVIENDIAFENVETEAEVEPAMDDLISESTRNAMGRAFAHLDRGSAELAAAGGGTLDALFTRAIQDAFMPTLQEWVDSHRAEILDELKPLIREWMDENLPNLIEAAVTKEITRASAAARPRKR